MERWLANIRAENEAATFALEPRTLPPKSVTYVVTPSDDSTAKAKTMRKGCACVVRGKGSL